MENTKVDRKHLDNVCMTPVLAWDEFVTGQGVASTALVGGLKTRP